MTECGRFVVNEPYIGVGGGTGESTIVVGMKRKPLRVQLIEI